MLKTVLGLLLLTAGCNADVQTTASATSSVSTSATTGGAGGSAGSGGTGGAGGSATCTYSAQCRTACDGAIRSAPCFEPEYSFALCMDECCGKTNAGSLPCAECIAAGITADELCTDDECDCTIHVPPTAQCPACGA